MAKNAQIHPFNINKLDEIFNSLKIWHGKINGKLNYPK